MCQPRRWLWGLLPLALIWIAAGFLRHESIQTDLTTRSINEALKAKAPWASATFDGRDATVSGVSPSPAVQKSAQDAVDSVFGVRRVDNKTTVMADVKPYIWSAAREGNKITLSGFAPNEATKTKIVTDTKAALPNTEVIDQMKIAPGVPAVFGAATAYSLAQLARLPDGKANLSDAALTITGTAPSADIYQVATAAGLPQGVAGSVQVGLPIANPYIWQAQKVGQAITLTGFVPSAEVKAKIAEAAKAAAPNATVTDQMRLAAGAPAGLETMATAALNHLAGLTSGIANLTGANYSLTGVAPTVEAFNRVMAAAKALPTGFTPAKADVTAPAISPYAWSAVRNGPAITLSGYVPDEATKVANAAAARAAVPNAMVTDQQSLGAGAPNGLAGMAAYAINQLGRLNSGTASLSNTAYTITGAAPTAAVRDETIAGTTRLPAGYTLARQEVTAPATPAPTPVVAPVVVPPPPPVVIAPPPPPPAPAPVVMAPPPSPVSVVDTCQQQFNALLNDPILFATNSDEIQSVSYILLGRLAGVAKTCPTRTIEIGAHTDTDGSPVYNQDLSERRAKAVVEFLVREGVAGTNLKSVGYGETKPIAPNDTPANKQKNRRVEFTVK
jgi:OmpA-OmpF porin, OOP family